MEAVEEAVYKDYKRWNKEEGNSGKDIDDFMEEMYAMKVGKGNIFDKIKAMALPLVSSDSAASSAALKNLASCANSNSSMTTRTKRSTRSNNNHNNKIILDEYSTRHQQSSKVYRSF